MNCKNCGQQLQKETGACSYCGFNPAKDSLDGTVKVKKIEEYRKPPAIKIIQYRSANSSATWALVLALFSWLPLVHLITFPTSLFCCLGGVRRIKYSHSGRIPCILSLIFNFVWVVIYGFIFLSIMALINA